MNPSASSHWSIGELRFATLPSVPPSLLREISEAFQLRATAPGVGSVLDYPVLLRSSDDSWAVRLEPSVLALETRADEPYDLLVQRLSELARLALPYLDTNFFTRTALRTIRSLPLSEAMESTRAIAEQANKFRMAMTSIKTGSSRAGHVIIQETVGLSQGLCTRDVGIYEDAVESSRLDGVLKKQVEELGEIELNPDQIELPPLMGQIDLPSLIDLGLFPVIVDVGNFRLPEFFRLSTSNGSVDLSESDSRSEVEKLNEDRIRLLARRYADAGFSREDEARLEILQARILHLLPSVEQRDFEHLEELASVTRRVHERHLERMNRLGLAK